MSKNICEVCSKTNRKIVNNNRTVKNNNLIDNKKSANASKKRSSFEREKHNSNPSLIDVIFDEKLINEQKEVEKELIRRLENERKFEKQNQKIDRKEEYVRRKSLGLQIDKELIEQIQIDEKGSNRLNSEQPNQISNSDNQINAISKNSLNPDSKSKLIENKESINNKTIEKKESLAEIKQTNVDTPQNSMDSFDSSLLIKSHITSQVDSKNDSG
jgi:hypothetical protein